MAVCPKCGKQIDHLRNYALLWRELRFRVEEDKLIHEPTGDIVFSDPVEEEYVCPECDAVLFRADKPSRVMDAEKEATAFLGKKE